MPKLCFNDVPVNQQQGKQGKLAALPQPAGCWSCPSPHRAPWGAALVGMSHTGTDEGPAHLETVKSPKTRGFWGSRVRRRKTSSAKRGVEVRHPELEHSPEDGDGHPGAVLEGAAVVELHCPRLQKGLGTHLIGRSASQCPEGRG